MNKLTNVFRTRDELQPTHTDRSIEIGPYKVRISNKTHYRLYTFSHKGQDVHKSASMPDVQQIMDSVKEGKCGHALLSEDRDQLLRAGKAWLRDERIELAADESAKLAADPTYKKVPLKQKFVGALRGRD